MRSSLHIVALVALAPAACRPAEGMTEHEARPTAIERPAGCVEVEPGAPIQPLLDDPAIEAVCLAPGKHHGPLRLSRAVTLWGPPSAVVDGPTGTIIELAAPHAEVLQLTLDGTGGSFDRLDGAIRLTADDTRAEGVTVINAMFGILAERVNRVRIIGNHVMGSHDPAIGLRGDTMRLWETRDSIVENNRVEDGRDLVVWYSRGNTLRNNRVEGGRYGMHFMYCQDNHVENNQFLRGVVGVFVMYSRNIHLTNNLIADAAGAAGMAFGIKDSGNIFIDRNMLIHDALGIYVDSSPMQRGDILQITGNSLRLNDAAVVFHSSAHDVAIHGNDLADNVVQVRVDGGGDARAVDWHDNYFDDYTGYDLDSDGIGDVPYELRSLSSELTSSHPALALFRGTPALGLVDAAAHLDPMYQPHPVLTDRAPRMAPNRELASLGVTP